MQDELINYLTSDEKIKMAKKLLKSALVYNHVKSLMLTKSENKVSLNPIAIEKNKERENFDKTRDYAAVIREECVLPDRLRNYYEILDHERIQMGLLLKTKEVRMQIVKDILEEEGLDLKKYFIKSCNRLVKNISPSFPRKIARKIGNFFTNSSKMKEKIKW